MNKYTIVAGEYQDVHNLSWTTELPTELGLYWAKPVILTIGSMNPEVVKVIRIDDGGLVRAIGETREFHFYLFSHWLGPIPEPEFP